MKKSLTAFSHGHIKAIHKLSRRYNRLIGKNHARALQDLISSHAQEIIQLYKMKNKHYITETGDLLVLCLELIREAHADADHVLKKCYGRYYKKLSALLDAYNNKGRKNR